MPVVVISGSTRVWAVEAVNAAVDVTCGGIGNGAGSAVNVDVVAKAGFDQFGNYTFGVKEHIIFPEVNFDKVEKIRGLDISIIIASKGKDHSLELLKKLNFPFKIEGRN